ncbi:hypothetical protein D3C75_414460 [compost metagenome]
MLLEGCDVALLSVDITASKPTHAINKSNHRLINNYQLTCNHELFSNYELTCNHQLFSNYELTCNYELFSNCEQNSSL